MKRFLILASMLAGTMASAQTTMYQYVSEPYQSTDQFRDPELTPVQFAPFTSSMRLKAVLTVEQPFPPNLKSEPIGPETDYPMHWSFNEGLRTYHDSDANHYLEQAQISTDADGNITDLMVSVLSSRPPYPNEQGPSGLTLGYSVDASGVEMEGLIYHNMRCYDNTDGLCQARALDQNTTAAMFAPTGVWSRTTSPIISAPATAQAVPGLDGWALMALAALLFGGAAQQLPKRRATLARAGAAKA